jgi:hypothetical protein
MLLVLLAGETIPLTVEGSDTISAVKSKIEDEKGFPPDKQRLIFKGRQLEDSHTLDECSVEEGSILYFVMHSGKATEGSSRMEESTLHLVKRSIPVYIRDLEGNITDLGNIHKHCSIQEVKLMIEDTIGVPADIQSLIWAGRTLEETESLVSYLFQGVDALTLHLVPKQRRVNPEGSAISPFQQKYSWSEHSLWSRSVGHGLCIEGKCTNRNCKAYEQTVIHNNSFKDFDFITSTNAKCPTCRERIKPERPGFCKCFYKISGVKLGEEGQIFETHWTAVGEEYIT